MKTKKRRCYLSAEEVHLRKKPIKIWGYDKSDKFVCRLEINAAGLEVFSSKNGAKMLCNWTWEELVLNLEKLKNKS
jgi:hypothetical protein